MNASRHHVGEYVMRASPKSWITLYLWLNQVICMISYTILDCDPAVRRNHHHHCLHYHHFHHEYHCNKAQANIIIIIIINRILAQFHLVFICQQIFSRDTYEYPSVSLFATISLTIILLPIESYFTATFKYNQMQRRRNRVSLHPSQFC